MAEIYRKSSLEKLSSPEQLDRMIVITSPSFWIAIAGAGLIVLVAVLWSVFGRLPQKLTVNGIYVSEAGMSTLYSDVNGTVATIESKAGDTVEVGDLLITVVSGDTEDQIVQLKSRIAGVEAITLESPYDMATSDNRELIDLKTQIDTLGNELDQARQGLKLTEGEYGAQKQLLKELEDRMIAAKDAFYQSLGTSANNPDVQTNFTDSQTAFLNKQAAYDSAVSAFASTIIQYRRILETAKENVLIISSSANVDDLKKASAVLEKAVLSIDPTQASLTGADPTTLQANLTLGGLYTEADAGWNSLQDQKKLADPARLALSEAEAAYLQAQDYMNGSTYYQTQLSAWQQVIQNEYSLASQNYSTQLSTVAGLESNINQMKIQVENASLNSEVQDEQLRRQFESGRAAVIDGLKRELENYLRAQARSQVTAMQAGTVAEVAVEVGSVIGPGSELMKLSKASELTDNNVIACYVPVSSGKKITKGMKVMIYPTTVNKQEYGHMEATVVHVDSYVTGQATMKNILGDDSLVSAFTQEGPVVAVTCALREDANTASGYYWSSDKGADLLLPMGTLISGDVIISEKAPITMIIPLLKEKLTVTAVSKGQG